MRIVIHFALNSYLTVIQSENKSLDSNKAATHNNIPPKILLQIVEATANTLNYFLVMLYQTVNFQKI